MRILSLSTLGGVRIASVISLSLLGCASDPAPARTSDGGAPDSITPDAMADGGVDSSTGDGSDAGDAGHTAGRDAGDGGNLGDADDGGNPSNAGDGGICAPRGGGGDAGDGGNPGNAGDGGPIAATMNDVSILFPLPCDAADLDTLLSASSSGARGTLLPGELYASIGPISGPSPSDASPLTIALYSSLRVVAMRIDPCFASLAPDPNGEGCQAQIRLVLQDLEGGDGGASAFDSALHLFYSLTRDEFLALARALVALRVANEDGESLGPLAPHPIMVKQGLAGPMSEGVKTLILQYAGEENLTRVAKLGIVPGLMSWTLEATDVEDAATAATSPVVIPTLPGDAGVTLQGVGTESLAPFRALFLPATTSTDNLTPLDDGDAGGLGEAAREAAFDSLVRIENPAYDSPNTIDCASCHLATPTEMLVAEPLFSLDDRMGSLAFQPDGESVVPADMTPTFGSITPIPLLNMHAFSYGFNGPAINQRVVNETARVVEYLNALPP
jgi:hypothetical protein